MPNKFVFPGGAVDAADFSVPLARDFHPMCAARLAENVQNNIAHALGAAAIRELWEETGLVLGQQSPWMGNIPEDWVEFAQAGFSPSAHPLQFVFRAITPPGRPRRFDARFFLVDAAEIASDLDDFSRAEDELSHLQWIALEDVRRFDLPFITEVVLAEVAHRLTDTAPPENVPFFHNDTEESMFLRLNGKGPFSGKPISPDD